MLWREVASKERNLLAPEGEWKELCWVREGTAWAEAQRRGASALWGRKETGTLEGSGEGQATGMREVMT